MKQVKITNTILQRPQALRVQVRAQIWILQNNNVLTFTNKTLSFTYMSFMRGQTSVTISKLTKTYRFLGWCFCQELNGRGRPPIREWI